MTAAITSQALLGASIRPVVEGGGIVNDTVHTAGRVVSGAGNAVGKVVGNLFNGSLPWSAIGGVIGFFVMGPLGALLGAVGGALASKVIPR